MLAASVAALFAACTEPQRSEPEADRDVQVDAPTSAPPPSAGPPPPLSVDDGRALVAQHECNRCHEGTGAPAAADDKSCVRCHERIATDRFPAPPASLAKWKPHVAALRHAPSLARAGAMLEPRWMTSYLLAPHDLRPALRAEMPRLDLDAREADAIARYLAVTARRAAPASDEEGHRGDADRGRRLFRERGCGTCHAFTGSGTSPPPTRPTDEARSVLAPDLAFARRRLRRAVVAAWIRDPGSVAEGATMPKQDVTEREAADLVAFVFDAPLDPPVAKRAPVRKPLLEREVRYQEVADRVLHKICWHCHSQPDYARGDGGPGNTGGFGFAGRGLDLSSYESIAAGYRDRDGELRSVFAPATKPGGMDEEPMLVAVLLAREHEVEGRYGAIRGMPLGLPPVSPDDVQLVASWVAQGHPR